MKRSSDSGLPDTKAIANLSIPDCKCAWIAGQSILAYGVRVGVRTDRPQALERISLHYPPLWKATLHSRLDRVFSLQVGGRRKVLYEDLEKVDESSSLERVLDMFERRLKIYVAEMARGRIFIHAGAVGWKGQAIIIPGSSYSGKTSLVAELVRRGATYYSDEYAVLDFEGRVHPYPQALAIRNPGSYEQESRPVAELGGVVGRKSLPVGLVLVSRYLTGARWRPSRLSTGQAVLEVLAHTVPARRKPEIVIPTLQRAVTNATVLKGVRGEAPAMANLILRQFPD